MSYHICINEVEGNDEDDQVGFIVKIHDAGIAEITLVQNVHSVESWDEISKEIRKALILVTGKVAYND